MRYYLGFDVGSSKTHAVVADEEGRCLGFGVAGSGNYQGVGYDGQARTLQAAFAQAAAAAGVTPEQIAGAGFGVAGYDWPSDRPAHLESIATLGLTCPVEIVNDAVNGLLAGTTQGWGVNVTAGSSNNCRGRDRQGREGRIVGNGSFFGEFGGGYEIALKGLQAVNYAWIRRDPPTALTRIYLDATGAADELDLMEGLSNDHYHLYPYLAVEVFRAAADGDAAACRVVSWAGQELGWLAVAVIRQLDLQDEPVEVVQSGTVFEGGNMLVDPMRDVVLQFAPHARLTRLRTLPVVGPVLLGMEVAGFNGYSVRETLVETIQDVQP